MSLQEAVGLAFTRVPEIGLFLTMTCRYFCIDREMADLVQIRLVFCVQIGFLFVRGKPQNGAGADLIGVWQSGKSRLLSVGA